LLQFYPLLEVLGPVLCGTGPREDSLGFAERYVDAAHEVSGQVVKHRTCGSESRDEDDVQRTEQRGVSKNPGRREPDLRVDDELLTDLVPLGQRGDQLRHRVRSEEHT